MNILYCGDSNIANGLILSVISLLNNTAEQINVYILTASLKTADRSFKPLPENVVQLLNDYSKQVNSNNSVELIDITHRFNEEPPQKNLETRFTPLCMLRLYSDCVPNLPDRLLYLDNDVICRKDFSEFYHQDLSEYELCGVLDHYGKWFFKNNPFKADYLNSGVLLLNLKKIRESGLFEKCRRRCAEKKMFMPDQSAINKLAKSKKICPRRFNEQRHLKEDTVFQHFTISFRFFPWIHTVCVKPWDTERMHSVLKLHEYDSLILQYEQLKAKLEK